MSEIITNQQNEPAKIIERYSEKDGVHPTAIPSPLFTKEILYRLLQGQNGNILKQLVMEGSSTHLIIDVIEQIMNNYDRSFRVEELAEI